MSQSGDKFNLYRTRNNSGGSQTGKTYRNQNTDDLLYNSSLSDEVLEEIEKVFVTDRANGEFDKSLIDDSTIRLLEELSVPHAKIALNEFAHRCKVAPEKIRKSIAGYLRGVCLKYWKIGRAATKQQLTEVYLKKVEHGERVNKRKLIEDFIGHTFTPGSQLDLLLIDSTVRKKLFQLEPCEALDVIFEFVSAVTFRTGKIRNINAYMMSMINKAKTAGQMKSIDEILNRSKYGKTAEEKFEDPPPPQEFFEQSHQETQEWFHQKLAEKEENEIEPPNNVWRNRQQSQEQMYENQDSSSSGGNVSTPAEVSSPFSQQEKMYLEEVIRQQNQVINNLRKKVSMMDSRLARYEGDPYENYDDTFFSQTPLNSFPNSPIQSDGMDGGLKDHGDFDFRTQFSRLQVQHDEYTRPRQRSEPVPNSHAISTHQHQYSSHVYDGY